eukprot:COSAG02_NODE_1760_length_11035_cov_7.151426_8_plen_141_part_00
MTKRKVAPLPPSVGDPGPRSTTLVAVDVVDTAEGLADGGAGNAGSAAGASKSNGQDAGRPMGLPLAAHRARVRDGEQPVVSPAGNVYPPLPRGVDRSIPDISTSAIIKTPSLTLAAAGLTMWLLCALRLCVGVVPRRRRR